MRDLASQARRASAGWERASKWRLWWGVGRSRQMRVPTSLTTHALVLAAVQEEVDEFFDAKSLLGSLQSTFSSFMTSSDASAEAGKHEMALSHMHDLAASVREVGDACVCAAPLLVARSASLAITCRWPRAAAPTGRRT